MPVDPLVLAEILGPDAGPCRRALTGEHGIALPPFVDHHVHLHLIDEHALAPGGLAAVVDLGGDPIALSRRPRGGFPAVSYAGAFLTTPGGYPAGRSWAPAAIVREVTSASPHGGVAGGAATAVDEQAEFGASVIKVALNASGPVLDGDALDTIVGAAHERGLPVVAHVEGTGMTALALAAGIDALAHTPFSEVLDAETIARAATSQTWISTLAIHSGDDLARASANLEAFARAGGRVLYGTDLGNGERPGGLQAEELAALDAAGIRGSALLDTLTDPWPNDDRVHGVASFVAGDPPRALDEVPAWLARATVVPEEELVRDAG